MRQFLIIVLFCPFLVFSAFAQSGGTATDPVHARLLREFLYIERPEYEGAGNQLREIIKKMAYEVVLTSNSFQLILEKPKKIPEGTIRIVALEMTGKKTSWAKRDGYYLLFVARDASTGFVIAQRERKFVEERQVVASSRQLLLELLMGGEFKAGDGSGDSGAGDKPLPPAIPKDAEAKEIEPGEKLDAEQKQANLEAEKLEEAKKEEEKKKEEEIAEAEEEKKKNAKDKGLTKPKKDPSKIANYSSPDVSLDRNMEAFTKGNDGGGVKLTQHFGFGIVSLTETINSAFFVSEENGGGTIESVNNLSSSGLVVEDKIMMDGNPVSYFMVGGTIRTVKSKEGFDYPISRKLGGFYHKGFADNAIGLNIGLEQETQSFVNAGEFGGGPVVWGNTLTWYKLGVETQFTFLNRVGRLAASMNKTFMGTSNFGQKSTPSTVDATKTEIEFSYRILWEYHLQASFATIEAQNTGSATFKNSHSQTAFYIMYRM
jgi:hypothetical protein